MATASKTISLAFKHIRKTALGGPIQPEESSAALDTLNGMLSGWVARGVDIGHRTLALGDTLNVLPENEEDVSWLLAEQLAPDFGFVSPDAFFIKRVQDAWSSVMATYWDTTPATIPKSLTDTPSSNWGTTRGVV